MKRYRVLSYDFDSRALDLTVDIRETWAPEVRESWLVAKSDTEDELIREFGAFRSDVKIRNFVDLGPAPFSVLAFHNRFLRQARHAFVMEGYFPALTGACALGERILNHLIRVLREDFRSSPASAQIAGMKTVENWNKAINVLESWGVLLPDVATSFRQLARIRNRSLHFDPAGDRTDHELALNAIRQLSDIVQNQFGALGPQPWFIPNARGVSFIKKSAEEEPFIKRVYLPNCQLVGSRHKLEWRGNGFVIVDDHEYEDVELSDQEFLELYEAACASRVTPIQ